MTPTPLIALAGRRIDPPNAVISRFPLENVPTVQARLEELFVGCRAHTLVCSAACGADLLALEVAASLDLQCRVVLPFDPRRFRETSVVDRPGDWGPLFDRLIDAVARAGDLLVLPAAGESDTAYAAVNQAILDEAVWLVKARESLAGPLEALSRPDQPIAVIVWDGKSRGEDDLSARFAAAARARGLPVTEVLTMDTRETAGAGA